MPQSRRVTRAPTFAEPRSDAQAWGPLRPSARQMPGRSKRLLALLNHHIGVVGVLGHLQPEVLIAAKRLGRLPVLLEVLVLGADLAVDVIGGFEADVEDR